MSDGNGTTIRLHAVGDVMVNREAPESIFELVHPIFAEADIVFGNCESTYSEVGSRNPATRGEVRAHPRNVDALSSARFDVMSFANNHHLDSGYEAFFNTLTALEEHNIEVCGAGKDVATARVPAIIESEGTKVAFLGYSSIMFPGYDAGVGRPGCAPLRIHTHYAQSEIEQPGSDANVTTYPYPEDLTALCDDIAGAREQADIVVVSPHWGVHFTPMEIAQYETSVGRAAIDAGADIVLGHHQHILKGVQVYKGKVIFHGLGNFAMDSYVADNIDSPAFREMQAKFPVYGVAHREDYPSYPFHPESRMTLIAQCDIAGGRITEVSYIPCYINPLGQPEPLMDSDPRFAEIASYMKTITESVGLDTEFKEMNDRVVVMTA
jgi:poly-gamma-glutamate capsule biosynthesis protein CapA/YwtB (metallophosphatase superfamily)